MSRHDFQLSRVAFTCFHGLQKKLGGKPTSTWKTQSSSGKLPTTDGLWRMFIFILYSIPWFASRNMCFVPSGNRTWRAGKSAISFHDVPAFPGGQPLSGMFIWRVQLYWDWMKVIQGARSCLPCSANGSAAWLGWIEACSGLTLKLFGLKPDSCFLDLIRLTSFNPLAGGFFPCFAHMTGRIPMDGQEILNYNALQLRYNMVQGPRKCTEWLAGVAALRLFSSSIRPCCIPATLVWRYHCQPDAAGSSEIGNPHGHLREASNTVPTVLLFQLYCYPGDRRHLEGWM